MRIQMTAILALLLTASAFGQTEAQRNAATWYKQAIDRWQTLSESDRELIANYDERKPASPDLRAALSRAQPMLELARRGASVAECDFQLDRSQGFEMLMPHLGQMRSIARTMNADACVRMFDGDSGGAAAAIADLSRMSAHAASDQILIGSLVGNAVFSLSDRTVQLAIDRGMFGPAESEVLLEALSTLNEKDPFKITDSIRGERELGYEWVARKFEETDNPGEAAEFMHSLVGGGDESALVALGLADPKGIDAALDGYGASMDRVVQIFEMADPEAANDAIAQWEADLESGAFGPLAKLLTPAIGRAMQMRDRSSQMLADRKAMLRLIASGRSTPQELANAAIWYVRGVKMLEQLPAPTLEAIRTFAADVSRKMSDDLATVIADKPVQQVVEIFREGSTKGRCDFAFAREDWWRVQVGFLPPYAAGMHDAFRILHCDAVRHLRAGESDQAAELLNASFGMSAHMAEDPTMVSALISHCDFQKTLNIAHAAMLDKTLTDSTKPKLLKAVQRIKRTDPFGLVGAAVTTRDELAKFFGGFVPKVRGERDASSADKVSAAIKSLNSDQVLYVLVTRNTMHENTFPERAAGTSQLLKRLDDVLSRADYDAVHTEMTQYAPMLAMHDYEFLKDRIIPAIASSFNGRWGANYADHVKRASSDLMQAHQTFAEAIGNR